MEDRRGIHCHGAFTCARSSPPPATMPTSPLLLSGWLSTASSSPSGPLFSFLGQPVLPHLSSIPPVPALPLPSPVSAFANAREAGMRGATLHGTHASGRGAFALPVTLCVLTNSSPHLISYNNRASPLSSKTGGTWYVTRRGSGGRTIKLTTAFTGGRWKASTSLSLSLL